MLQVGKFNKLKVVKTVDFGVYLDGGEKGEILLPRKFVPKQSCSEGGEIDVFVYYDSEDRLIATTQKPYAQVGEFAWLQVKSVNRIGAFLDWSRGERFVGPVSGTKYGYAARRVLYCICISRLCYRPNSRFCKIG